MQGRKATISKGKDTQKQKTHAQLTESPESAAPEPTVPESRAPESAAPSVEEDPDASADPGTVSDDPPERHFPIVGIGASAGGLAAFEAFFSGMPANTDPGMAFVLVQHLDPSHKSILTDLIRRYTRMQVFEVEDGMVVMPNRVYVIPPNHDMAFLNGALQLMEPSAPHGQRLPINFFFRSLARDQHKRAICIVLSGTGSDGTLGVRAIKGEGGMVMAQNPGSVEYDGMPRSAIATGLVDYELPPAEMPAQLIAYVAHAFGKPPRPASALEPKSENALRKIFVQLRDQTGRDHSLNVRRGSHGVHPVEGGGKLTSRQAPWPAVAGQHLSVPLLSCYNRHEVGGNFVPAKGHPNAVWVNGLHLNN